MKVQCPCGELLKHLGDPSSRFADYLPSQLTDAYCELTAKAVKAHVGDADVATQYAIDATTGLFRRMCQCPKCGRLFVEDSEYRVFEFLPANTDNPNNLFERG
ncbi:MAG: hypothetical protein R3C18_26000 [Planctomycetaceae bacterium]